MPKPITLEKLYEQFLGQSTSCTDPVTAAKLVGHGLFAIAFAIRDIVPKDEVEEMEEE